MRTKWKRIQVGGRNKMQAAVNIVIKSSKASEKQTARGEKYFSNETQMSETYDISSHSFKKSARKTCSTNHHLLKHQ